MDFQSAKRKAETNAFIPSKMLKMGRRSHTHKGCNAMYAHNFLNIQWIFNPQKVLES